MAHIYRLIALLMIVASGSAFAVPKVGYGWVITNGQFYPTGVFSTYSEAAQAGIAAWNARNPGYNATCSPTLNTPTTASCNICSSRGCGHGGIGFRAEGLTCPANSTESSGGQSCQCNAGYEETQDGQCVIPSDEDALEEECRNRSGSSREGVVHQPGRGEAGPRTNITSVCHVPEAYDPGGGSSGIPMFPGTNKGCAASFEYEWSGREGDDWYSYGRETYTGGTCTPGGEGSGNEGDGPGSGEEGDGDSDTESKEPSSCKGQEGTVNGVKVCLPYDSTEGSDGTSTTRNPDGSSSESETVTKCKGGTCTSTTTTTNKDPSGNPTGTSSVTVTLPRDNYCAKNPGASACKSGGSGFGDEDGDSSFGGSCDAGWTCEGDAIQCAIAKRQHEDSCEMKKETPESRLYGQSKDKTGKVTGDLEGNETHNFAGTLNTSPRFAASSCVRDLTVVIVDHSVTLPFSDICPHLANIGYVLLMVAGVIAVVIVMRGR